MADPVFVNCTKDAWTKVATNVTSGIVHQVYAGEYLQTYKMTGGAAPTLQSDGVEMFESSQAEIISATAGIDVYVWPLTNAGRVRVDL